MPPEGTYQRPYGSDYITLPSIQDTLDGMLDAQVIIDDYLHYQGNYKEFKFQVSTDVFESMLDKASSYPASSFFCATNTCDLLKSSNINKGLECSSYMRPASLKNYLEDISD